MSRWDEPDDVDVLVDAAHPLSQNIAVVVEAIRVVRA
jgi:hypothetical protein